MRDITEAAAAVTAVLVLAGSAGAGAPPGLGQQEFGLSERQLTQNIEKVEQLTSRCMREQGFEYIPVDYKTVQRAMQADKLLPGLSEQEFIARYGFGIATLYTGGPPQLATGYSPAKMGMGRQNNHIYQQLSPADQAAYSRALCGSNPGATFAVGLQAEDFSRIGGCTRDAIAKVFEPQHLKQGYYNPRDALIAGDPRMRAALRTYISRMREAGFDVRNPDMVESLVVEQLDAITGGGEVPIEQLTPGQRLGLEKLKDFEIRLAAANFKIETEVVEAVSLLVERELFARQVE
jgi:hypothetical protein